MAKDITVYFDAVCADINRLADFVYTSQVVTVATKSKQVNFLYTLYTRSKSVNLN